MFYRNKEDPTKIMPVEQNQKIELYEASNASREDFHTKSSCFNQMLIILVIIILFVLVGLILFRSTNKGGMKGKGKR